MLNWFKRKYKVTILFKSGQTLTFKAEDFTVYKKGNELTSMEYKNTSINLMFTHLDSIASIYSVKG